MEQSKIFKILLDGDLINTVPITNTTTIKDVKNYFNDYLLNLGKDPLDYSIKIYLNNLDKLDVDNTNEYDDINLHDVWNKITNGSIVLTHSPNYFRRLYPDAIYQIALKLNLEDLSNLCRVDKRMTRICDDNNFWLTRFNTEYGIMNNRDKEPWKDFYKNVKYLANIKPKTDLDLSNYGKYLTNLNLEDNKKITDKGLKHLPNLISLELGYNKNITDKGLKYLPNLISLNLDDNRIITDEGLKHVPDLTILNLKNNENITNKGLKYVPNLTILNLRFNENITNAGLKYLHGLTKVLR